MNYFKIYNDFWRKHTRERFSVLELAVFHYIVHRCDLNRGKNPIAIPTICFQEELGISRGQLSKARRTLSDRGLISFIEGSRKQSPIYTLLSVQLSGSTPVCVSESVKKCATDCAVDCVPRENTFTTNTTKTTITKDSKESYDDINKKSLKTGAQEKENMFERCVKEVREGKHSIWADQMAKKHGISSVDGYLDAFRDHAISNARYDLISDINDFKRYFNSAFRYFSRKSPSETLHEFRLTAPDGSEEYRKYCDWMHRTFPRLSHGLQPLTESEFDTLFSTYRREDVIDTIYALNDHPQTLERHLTLFEPLLQWLRRAKTKAVKAHSKNVNLPSIN